MCDWRRLECMDPFILIDILCRFLSIFTAFTFTNFEDFLPLLSLILGIVVTIRLRRSAEAGTSPHLPILMVALIGGVFLPNVGLYFLAREFQAVYGSWPQVMIDDPRGIGDISVGYAGLRQVIPYLHAFSGAWLANALMLFAVARSRLSATQRRSLAAFAIVWLLVCAIAPGNLYAWWID